MWKWFELDVFYHARNLSITNQILKLIRKTLKLPSCKLYKNKYMIASTQLTNIETFEIVAVLVFKLLSGKVFLMNRKDNRNC